MPNPVVHFEIRSSGSDELQRFYADLFDWNVDASNPMNYGLVDTRDDRGINGGIAPANGEPNLVSFYVEVEEIDAKLREAEERGGTVVMPVTSIPGMVTFAMFQTRRGTASAS